MHKDVVVFGVVVSYPKWQFSFVVHVADLRCKVPVFCEKGQLFLDVFCSAMGIELCHFHKIVQPLPSVVKVGNGYVELVHGDIGKQFLELAKRIPRAIEDFAVFDSVESDRVRNVRANSPVLSV